MNRLAATMTLDVKLQNRNQLYAIGVGVAVVLGLLVRFLIPQQHVGRGLTAFYVLGLGGTTFMFGASMLLLEKAERTLEAIRLSMMTTRDYVVSKAVTLTAFALVESAIVYAIAGRGISTNFVTLTLGATVLGVFYSLLGLALSARHDAVTKFLLPTGTAASIVLQLPFLSLMDLGPDWLWYAIPTQAPLLIIQGSFEPLTAGQWIYAAVMSAAMIGGAYALCVVAFRRHIRFPEKGRA